MVERHPLEVNVGDSNSPRTTLEIKKKIDWN